MNLSLARINFLNVLVTALLFSIIIGAFTINTITSSFETKKEQLENDYIEKNKQLIKDEVLRATKRVRILEDISYQSLRSSLEEKVDLVYDLLNASSNTLSKNQTIKKHSALLDSFKWDDDTGYFYIFDTTGRILYHGSNHNYANKNIFTLMKSNKELEKFINEAFQKEDNFGSYHWYMPYQAQDKLYKKYVYAKRLENSNIYIAAGIYKNKFQEKVKNIIITELEKERFGEDSYGYFWVHSSNYEMLMHPTRKELVGMDLSTFKSLDGQLLFQNMNKIIEEKNGGYISYIWYKPNTSISDEKISYIHKVPDYDLVLGSGFYLTELKDILKNEKAKLDKALSENLKNTFLVMIILIFLSLLMAWFISKRIEKVELSQKEQMNMLEQYQLILDKSAVVSKANKKGIITYVNDNFAKVSGYTKEEVIGKAHNIVRHSETPKRQFQKLWETISSGEIWHGILKNKKKDGNSYYNSTTIVPIKDSDGNILEYISSGSDVTEIFENRSKLQNIFKTDALTGLGNRVALIDDITKKANGTLALINIDRFKEINDLSGHEVGDEIIKRLGSRLFKYIKDEPYSLYRVQGDIFALFSEKEEIDKVIEKIEKFFSIVGKKPYDIKQKNYILTYSCGIANNTDNLLSFADMALSEAKNKKLQIKLYEPSMNNIDAFKQNILWVEKLHKAIAEDRIVPYFQPIYNYHTNRIEKYESLMRYIENDEVVSPAEYLDIAKKTKLYSELTYKMAGKAISKFANRKEEFSINLSIEDLMNEKLMLFVYDYAEQKNVFSRMVLEIVESEEIEDNDQISNIIKRFKDAGVKVAIDDFGSGYSNYDYLISLQADYIKIDGSIIKHILEDERTAEVVRSIVNFAKKSDMKTIAEFVSSKELDEKVKELGVDYAQGWFYGKAEKEPL